MGGPITIPAYTKPRTLAATNLKRIFIISALLAFTTSLFAQVVKRLDNEKAEQFVARVRPDKSDVPFKVIETKWNSLYTILAFYNQTYRLTKHKDPDQQEFHRIIGEVYVESNSNYFYKLLIDTIDSEGGDPNIQDVFFANADNDTNTELIIIATWEQQHYAVSGTLYGTFIYDNVLTTGQTKLKLLKTISNKMDGGCECKWQDGKSKKVRLKTAGDIKKELARQGYKQ